MKEAQMLQPNKLGHYHRDIVSARPQGRYYMKLVLSCGHNTSMSKQAYKKHQNSAVLCVVCSA